MRKLFVRFSIFAVFMSTYAQQHVTINPEKDNTLYETTDGSLSSGKGTVLHIGTIGQKGDERKNRAVVKFNIGNQIPHDAIITDVQLKINVVQVKFTNPENAVVHRITSDWGEGTSDGGTTGKGAPSTAGDATWIHSIYDSVFWQTPGGDFSMDTSSSIAIGAAGSYTFPSTATMISDVTGWLHDSTTNLGWIIIGNEKTAQTVKVIDSRESTTPALRPQLDVTYTVNVLVNPNNSLPKKFELGQNFPNPFNPATTIRYMIPRNSFVSLTVYNILGSEITSLVGEVQSAGVHTVTFDASALSSGLYFYRLRSEQFTDTKSMILLK